MMLHTKYQGSRPGGFRQEDFFMFQGFLKFHLKNLFLACMTLICNGLEQFEQFLKRAIQGWKNPLVHWPWPVPYAVGRVEIWTLSNVNY